MTFLAAVTAATVWNAVWKIAVAVIVIAFMIMTHELGHYFAAKKVGIKVDQFSIGFGPEIVGWTKGETRYSIKWFLAGGSVRIAGMNPEEEISPEDLPRTYYEAPYWKRAIVIFAGSFVHIVIAFVLFYIVFWPIGFQDLTGNIAHVEKSFQVGNSLVPGQTTVGTPAFRLTVTGKNFIPKSVVKWDKTALSTTYDSSTRLSAAVPASLVSNTGNAKVTVINPSPAGGTSNAQTFVISDPLPAVTSVSPNSGAIGDTVTIGGNHFGSSRGSSIVSFNSIQAASYGPWSDRQIKVKIPAGVTTGPIVVTTSAGISKATPFTVTSTVPSGLTLSPGEATVGGQAFKLTVTGKNFVRQSVIKWDSKSLSTTFNSSTMLHAQVPASLVGQAGTATVTVVNPASAGGTSGAQSFLINKPIPLVTSISPPSGLIGDTVTIAGTRFGTKQGNGFVVFNNTQADAKGYVSWADNQIKVLVPKGATTGPVAVVTDGGTSNEVAFAVKNIVPSGISLSPAKVIVKGPSFRLTVTGRNFLPQSSVEWTGQALSTTYASGTVLTAEVPASLIEQTGTEDVTVTNPGKAGGTSNTAKFIVTDPLPVISSVSPKSSNVGDAVTITGHGFDKTQDNSLVSFNDKPATAYTSWSDNQIRVKVPDGATSGPIVVVSVAGDSNHVPFVVQNINPVPRIETVVTRPGPAFVAGLQAGDLITSVDGIRVNDWNELAGQLTKRPGQVVTLVYDRGTAVRVTYRTRATLLNVNGSGLLGIVVDQNSTFIKKSNPVQAIGQATKLMGATIAALGKGISSLFSLTTLRQLIGVAPRTQNSPRSIVGAAQLSYQAAKQGASTFIFILGELFLVLALFNLLPLPPLDGGHLLVIVVEKVFHKKVNMQTFAKIAWVVIILLSVVALRLILLDIFNPLKSPF